MLVAKDFRKEALSALKGNWGVAILSGFVATLLGAQLNGGGNSSSAVSRFTDNNDADNSFIRLPYFKTLVIVLLIWTIVSIIIGGVITLGYARFNLNLIDRTGARFGDLFSEFDRFGDGFCMQLLRNLYIFLWTLLFIIPGIIASYSYAMTPYIMAEHPELGTNQAISKSKQIMSGNRWRLFCLDFSFIGWTFLCAFTLGIGLLWLIPYKEAARTAFYRDLVKEQVYIAEYL